MTSTDKVVFDAHVCQLVEDLASAGICAASKEKRLLLAQKVLKQDTGEQRISPAELDALLRRARAQKARSPAGLVYHWLNSNTWRSELTVRENRPSWEPPEEWKEEVRTHAVVSVALMDRKSAEAVAGVFGLTAERVRELVDTAGRNTYGDRAADLWLGRAKPPAFKRSRGSDSGKLPTPRELGLR